MKRRWIFLSLVTGLIILAGVMFIDFYRNVNHNGSGALQETNRVMDQDSQHVLQPQDSFPEETGFPHLSQTAPRFTAFEDISLSSRTHLIKVFIGTPVARNTSFPSAPGYWSRNFLTS